MNKNDLRMSHGNPHVTRNDQKMSYNIYDVTHNDLRMSHNDLIMTQNDLERTQNDLHSTLNAHRRRDSPPFSKLEDLDSALASDSSSIDRKREALRVEYNYLAYTGESVPFTVTDKMLTMVGPM